MSHLWSNERITAELQPCLQGVKDREVLLALHMLMRAMRSEYEQHIAQVEAESWQPAVDTVTIHCVDKKDNLLAYLSVQGTDISVATQRHTYSALLPDAYRLCRRVADNT